MVAIRSAGFQRHRRLPVALAVLVIPIVVRTTEDMLRLIPANVARGGHRRWARRNGKSIVFDVLPCSTRRHHATGILLAVARVAPVKRRRLLFTSLGNLNWSISLTKPMSSLPVTIYQYAGSAFNDWVQLAWVGALLITLRRAGA